MLKELIFLCFVAAGLADGLDEVRHECPGNDYILNRSGCRVWCRSRIPHPTGFGMKAVDYVIADRRDGLPCIGARESDSASESTSESSSSSESDSDESSNNTLQNVETVLNEAEIKRSPQRGSDSSDSSDSSSASYEIVIDPLYMGVCRQGVCVPTYRK